MTSSSSAPTPAWRPTPLRQGSLIEDVVSLGGGPKARRRPRLADHLLAGGPRSRVLGPRRRVVADGEGTGAVLLPGRRLDLDLDCTGAIGDDAVEHHTMVSA